MEINSLITDLAFILLLGAIVTILFKWIKQPVVLGYIVAGFLASPNFEYLPSVNTEENIEFWAQIGIIILLFSLGLEFSFKKLVNSGGSAVVTALIIVSGMMCAGFAVGKFMGFTTINCLFLGGMLSMSSTTIIIKAFNDLGLRQKKFTSLVLAVLIVEDLFAVVMMVLLSSIAINNSVEGGQLLYSVAKLIFFLIIWFLVGVYVLPSIFNRTRKFLNSETLLVISMGLCLGMAVFSVYCGFSLALGAFVMGSILAGTSLAERIEQVVAPVKDLFGAVFFISVGMMVQPHIIAQYWLPILILSTVVIVGMIVFGTFGMLVTGQTLRIAIESGFSLTQIGEFAFIIATLGMSLGVLNPEIYPIVVAVSVLTTFGTPYFIKMAPGVYQWIERHLPKRLHFLIDRYQREATLSNAVQRQWVIILKRHLWTTLLYTIILIALQLVSRQYLMPWLDEVVPSASRILCAVLTIVAMSPFLMALLIPINARKLNDEATLGTKIKTHVPVIVMNIFRIGLALSFVVTTLMWHFSIGVGVSFGIIILLLIGVVFSRRIRQQTSHIEAKFMDNLNERDLRRSGKKSNIVNDLHVAYVTVGNASKYVGQRLLDSNLRKHYGTNIVSIHRGSEVIPIPSAQERLFPGDVVTIIGTDEQISSLLPHIEVNNETAPIDPGDFKITSVMLTANSPLIGLNPVNSHLRDRYEVLLIAVQRGDDYLDATPTLTFAAADILWLVGTPKNVAAIK